MTVLTRLLKVRHGHSLVIIIGIIMGTGVNIVVVIHITIVIMTATVIVLVSVIVRASEVSTSIIIDMVGARVMPLSLSLSFCPLRDACIPDVEAQASSACERKVLASINGGARSRALTRHPLPTLVRPMPVCI